jgi:hypothetical protein
MVGVVQVAELDGPLLDVVRMGGEGADGEQGRTQGAAEEERFHRVSLVVGSRAAKRRSEDDGWSRHCSVQHNHVLKSDAMGNTRYEA